MCRVFVSGRGNVFMREIAEHLVKALVLATGYLKGDGIDVACVPEFADVAIDDKVRTAIKLVIEPRK